jgi:CTP synthase (UTP-ammonia lyase)
MSVAIGVVGDYDPTRATHVATTAALHHAAQAQGIDLELTWLPTDKIAEDETLPRGLDGLLVAPGSPYASMDGALSAIRVARTADIPLLGTCGGFQHVVLEFARNVVGVGDAGHAEYDPEAPTLFITPLSCSLAGQQMTVELRPGSRAAVAHGATVTTERYYCDFGLNPDYLGDLTAAGLVVSGVDQDGEVRVVELPGRRFFVATLFVPQTSSRSGHPHPLVATLLAAAAKQ